MKRDQAAWDKQTIEMVDALLTHGLILRTRLNAEYRRLKRLPDVISARQSGDEINYGSRRTSPRQTIY